MSNEILLSSWIIIHNGDLILIGKIGLFPWYDIPKWVCEENESTLETAMRETKEEFWIEVPSCKLKDLWEFEYIPHKKRLYLYEYKLDNFPSLNKLSCNTTFIRDWIEYPEIVWYSLIPFEDMKYYLCYNMNRVLSSIFLNNK